MTNFIESASPYYCITIADKFVNEIKSFSNLKKGWDYGLGSPISSHIINRAIKAYNYLKDSLFEYECSPLPNGNIQLTFSLMDNFIDVIVSNGSYRVIHEKGIGSDYETLDNLENASLEKIKTILHAIKSKCFSLGQSIFQGIVSANADLTNVLQTWVVASPSLHMIAQSKGQKQFALI